MPIDLLLSTQNRDGGWSYVRGASWTEPTVYATLALLASGEAAAAQRGLGWLRARQLSDGGWPPRAGIDDSCWVTALAALLPHESLGAAAHEGAIRWLLRAQGEESTLGLRVREWLLGINTRTPEQEFPGWPWVPGSAAWIGPTSLALLALDKEFRRKPSNTLRERIQEGRNFLLRRMCAQGGWNHGSVRALGYESAPYPETTGMALAAMRGMRVREVSQSVAVAKRFLAECRSADACNWLRLGLLAHGQLPAGYTPPAGITYRTLIETSLDVLVNLTQNGRDLFWS
jgi:Prenyltransferase and squalene oxidase repeat